MVIKILNKKWKIKVLKPLRYVKCIGSGSCAECHIHEKTIYVNRDHLNKETVMHELTHAYVSELGFVELELDDDQIEEFFCELFARHSLVIHDQAKKILEYFIKK